MTMRSLADRLRACCTGAVRDALRTMGHERAVLPPGIEPLDPTLKLACPVRTVSGHVDRTTSRRGIPDAYGAPVAIGGAAISKGGCLLADRDGVVIVPKAFAGEGVLRTEEVASTETEMRKALVGGMGPVDAYNAYGKF